MTPQRRKQVTIAGAVLLVIVLIIYGFLPESETVEVVEAREAPMEVVVEEEGVTRVDDRYVVSAPAAAYARRIDFEVGDTVTAGDLLVQLDPPRLDPRSRTQARARIEQAEAALAGAREQMEAARAAAERMIEERERIERLLEKGSATRQQAEQVRAEARQAEAQYEAARSAVAAARADLVAARAALDEGTADVVETRETLRAPTSGRILALHHQSAGMVAPGEPLLEIGNTGDLEVRVDLLSEDAVRIEPGTPVYFDQWGGEGQLEGRVERVDPQGFTQVSSLGVEEQRVAVVADLVSLPDRWANLGSGYRVLARFVVWQDEEVLQAPTSALFRTEEGWAVFAVEEGRAVRRPVEIGHQTGLETEILSGIEAGTPVIAQPGNEIEDGMRVEPRG